MIRLLILLNKPTIFFSLFFSSLGKRRTGVCYRLSTEFLKNISKREISGNYRLSLSHRAGHLISLHNLSCVRSTSHRNNCRDGSVKNNYVDTTGFMFVVAHVFIKWSYFEMQLTLGLLAPRLYLLWKWICSSPPSYLRIVWNFISKESYPLLKFI